MISHELERRIAQIELLTKKHLSGSVNGVARSKHKGSGFEFDQIREYQPGDDIRFIDWKSSARSNKLLVKQYNEERIRTVMLVVDGSASGLCTSSLVRKYDVFSQLAVIFGLVAQASQDAVGLIIFTDTIEVVVPPAKGHAHLQEIIQALICYTPHGTTNIESTCRHLLSMKRRDLMMCLFSDFIDYDDRSYMSALSYLARVQDVVAVQYHDQHEKQVPVSGYINVQDIETGDVVSLDVSLREAARISDCLSSRAHEHQHELKKAGVDLLNIVPEKIGDYQFIPDIVNFFNRRMG